MRLILVGCEYSGTTTLAKAISGWAEESMGARLTVHDHFKFPHVLHEGMADEEVEQILALPADVRAAFQWHMMAYHTMPAALEKQDYILVGLHIDEAVYAPLYKGYGMSWRVPAVEAIARYTDTHIMSAVPDILMILVKASPDVIARRLEENPHRHGMLRKDDIAYVLGRFEEECKVSSIRRKTAVLDTSTATVEETLAEFVEKVEPLLTNYDRSRLLDRSLKA